MSESPGEVGEEENPPACDSIQYTPEEATQHLLPGNDGASTDAMMRRLTQDHVGDTGGPDPQLQDQIAMPSGYHLSDVLTLSMCFFFTFTAFHMCGNALLLPTFFNIPIIWSSGAQLNLATIAFCVVTPPFVRRLSPKITIMICTIATCILAPNIFSATHILDESLGVTIAGNVLFGLVVAPFWTAQQTYLTSSAHLQARLDGSVVGDTINRYNGVFFSIFKATPVRFL